MDYLEEYKDFLACGVIHDPSADTIRRAIDIAMRKGFAEGAQKRKSLENDMSTVEKEALLYVECYELHFPGSGAKDVARRLRDKIFELKRRPDSKGQWWLFSFSEKIRPLSGRELADQIWNDQAEGDNATEGEQ